MTKHMFTAMATGIALLAATPAIAQQGGSTVTTATTEGPILSFSVSEEVRSRPDQATVGAGVTTTAPTAVEAMRLNAAAMDKLIAAAKARGIKAEDIQTSGISLSPQYDYNNRSDGQPPRFLGYQVSNSVRATTPKIEDIGPLLDALVAAGGTNIDGPWFAMKDPDAQLVGVRGAAIKAAEAKAADYAKLAGYRAAELVSISEGGAVGGPVPMPRVQMMAAEAKSTPVEPGHRRHRRPDGLLGGRASAHDLDERHQVRRVEWVGDDDPLGVAAGVLEPARPEARGAAGQDHVGGGGLVERGEELALEVHPLRPGLDDQVGARGRLGGVRVDVQPVEHAGVGAELAQVGGHRGAESLLGRRVGIGGLDAQPLGEGERRPAAADRAGADDGDGGDVAPHAGASWVDGAGRGARATNASSTVGSASASRLTTCSAGVPWRMRLIGSSTRTCLVPTEETTVCETTPPPGPISETRVRPIWVRRTGRSTKRTSPTLSPTRVLTGIAFSPRVGELNRQWRCFLILLRQPALRETTETA